MKRVGICLPLFIIQGPHSLQQVAVQDPEVLNLASYGQK